MDVYVVMMNRVFDAAAEDPKIKVFATKDSAWAYYHRLVDACDALVNDEHPDWSSGYGRENENASSALWSRYNEYDYNGNHIDITLEIHEVN